MGESGSKEGLVQEGSEQDTPRWLKWEKGGETRCQTVLIGVCLGWCAGR